MEYLIPLAIFAALGILAGVLLTVASKVFAVEVDERVDAIAEALPQANCGACGFSGCADYADAIVNKGAECNLCYPNRLGNCTGSSVMNSGFSYCSASFMT